MPVLIRHVAAHRLGWILLQFLAVVACSPTPRDASEARWTLGNVNVVDVDSGYVRPHMAVRIVGRRITDIVPTALGSVDRNSAFIDGKGAYVIPGLYDMHVHLAPNGHLVDSTLKRLTEAGVLGVRDMGFPLDSLAGLAALHNDRHSRVVHPRVWYVGPTLDAAPLDPEWPADVDASDSLTAADVIRESRRRGATAVKVSDRLSPTMYRAIVRIAAEQGLPVVGHIPASVSLNEVVAARQRSIEHLGGLAHGVLAACSSDTTGSGRLLRALASSEFFELYRTSMSAAHLNPLMDGYDARRCRQVADSLRHADIWQVPNLLLWKVWASDTLLLTNVMGKPTRDDMAARRRLFATTSAVARVLFDAGVPLLLGTDGIESLPAEMELLVNAGIPALAVLRAGTRDAAHFLGVADSLGSVRRGSVADFVLLERDPLRDVRNVRSVVAVVQGGSFRRVRPPYP